MAKRTPEKKPKPGKLPPKWVALMGTMTDRELSERFGVDTSVVAHRRRKLGIKPFKPRRPNTDWTDEMLSLLGTKTDGEVARELKLPIGVVRNRRRSLRIPPYGWRDIAERSCWSMEMLRQLGKRDDRELAKAFGLSIAAVARKRSELGLPRKQDKGTRRGRKKTVSSKKSGGPSRQERFRSALMNYCPAEGKASPSEERSCRELVETYGFSEDALREFRRIHGADPLNPSE